MKKETVSLKTEEEVKALHGEIDNQELMTIDKESIEKWVKSEIIINFHKINNIHYVCISNDT